MKYIGKVEGSFTTISLFLKNTTLMQTLFRQDVLTYKVGFLFNKKLNHFTAKSCLFLSLEQSSFQLYCEAIQQASASQLSSVQCRNMRGRKARYSLHTLLTSLDMPVQLNKNIFIFITMPQTNKDQGTWQRFVPKQTLRSKQKI